MIPSRLLRLTAAIGALAAAIFSAACNVVPPAQTDSTRYFILAGAAPAPASPVPTDGLWIGLHSVQLPAYLKTPQIVVRTGPNEVIPLENERWGEPLEAGLARIVREQLESSPAVGRIFAQPFPLDTNRSYDVSVDVRSCEGDLGSGRPLARFSAEIEVTSVPDGRVVARKFYEAPPAGWDGKDYGALAARLGEDAAALGREAAAALPAR